MAYLVVGVYIGQLEIDLPSDVFFTRCFSVANMLVHDSINLFPQHWIRVHVLNKELK